MSESIYLVAIPGMLLVAVLCIEKPTVWRFGSLGLIIAIATLIRSEAVDFIALLGVPVLLMAVGDWRRRIQTGLALVVGFALILTPWLVHNEVQLGGATLSTNGGGTLDGSFVRRRSIRVIFRMAVMTVAVHSSPFMTCPTALGPRTEQRPTPN